MSRFPRLLAAALLLLAAPAVQAGEKFGLGRPALPEEIAAWDVDVLPDGAGLPAGRGDVARGEELFSEKCASCHGEFAEGVDNWPELAGGFDTLADDDPVKTVGSYWPHLSTVWDYVHRSMPYGAAQTLEDDEVYAIVAYILYSNDLVDEEFELTRENFLQVELPNAGGFRVDDRPESEYPAWRREPCMRDCKEGVEITMRATVLDVTPEDEAEEEAAAAPAAAPAATTAAPATAVAALDPALVAAGEKAFRKCKACHTVGDDSRKRTGAGAHRRGRTSDGRGRGLPLFEGPQGGRRRRAHLGRGGADLLPRPPPEIHEGHPDGVRRHEEGGGDRGRHRLSEELRRLSRAWSAC